LAASTGLRSVADEIGPARLLPRPLGYAGHRPEAQRTLGEAAEDVAHNASVGVSTAEGCSDVDAQGADPLIQLLVDDAGEVVRAGVGGLAALPAGRVGLLLDLVGDERADHRRAVEDFDDVGAMPAHRRLASTVAPGGDAVAVQGLSDGVLTVAGGVE